MKLYYSKGACSLVVRIVIHELGLQADYEAVDLNTKKTANGADFLKINPKGAVPVIQLDNQKILTENAVILQYLADNSRSYQLLPEIGSFQRYQVLEWLNYITTELHKSFGVFFNPNISQDLKQSVFIPIVEKKFNYVNEKLGKNDYLMPNHFSLPDAYLFVMLRWANDMTFDLKKWPNLQRFFERMKDRESVQESLKEEGLE